MRRETDGSMISTDFQALSLFRMIFSVYLLCDFFVTTYPFFADFYGDTGILPISALAADGNTPGLFAVLPLVEVLNLIQSRTVFAVLYSTALIAFALGYRTRWANAFAFIFSAYLYWRNPYLDSGAETLARLLLLWCLFLPMARYWSVDAALDPEPRDRPYPVLPFLALRVQIASLYLFAALFKLAGVPWRDARRPVLAAARSRAALLGQLSGHRLPACVPGPDLLPLAQRPR
jgi:Vitamin K-dependent gamma-carboxylase